MMLNNNVYYLLIFSFYDSPFLGSKMSGKETMYVGIYR